MSPDVVIVGCGAGGGVLAKELGEAGLSVVVLEAGRRYDPLEDYPTERTDFELRASRVFLPDDPRRDAYTSDPPFFLNRVKGVGGSTLHYVGISPRFHESDFRVRSLEGVAADWPIDYAELEPYYTRVEYELGVSGPDGALANPFEPPRSRPFPTPPHELTASSRAVKRGADALGLHFVPVAVAIPTREWNGRPACIEAGTCQLGCRIAAKSSIDVTYVPKAEATGRVELRTRATARAVTVGADGKARSVVYFDEQGREQEVAGRAIVLAGGAVETARLLLLSGLANSSGLVGKCFMEHVSSFVTGVFPERLEAWRGVPSGATLQDYYATDRRNAFVRGFTVVMSNHRQWPLAAARHVPGWGAAHKARLTELFAHTANVATIGEALPDERNRIELDPVVRDLHGLPAPRIVFRLFDNERAMLRTMSARLHELLRAAGAREVIEDDFLLGNSSHYMGGCRMGDDPRSSVVDRFCRCHDVPNLFIGDGSVFVTSAAVNPALTISALAARTADGIVAAFRRGEL
ncbi:MAG TPA: GMC family oxidoreductase [Candidatus Polarisedimenticolaceae bacterium]|nr:GMC family oxidoreductase [Candidatus Polarisedimenticolaceae bacterium]